MQRNSRRLAKSLNGRQGASNLALRLNASQNSVAQKIERRSMMYKIKERLSWPGRLRKAGRFVAWVCGALLLYAVLLKFINPPATPLIAIRALEYQVTGRDISTQWEWVSLEDIPLHVQQSVVAAEDARFMDHWGIDLAAMGDAIEDSNDRHRPRGASTITMQTVKNVFLWPGRSYLRKCIEALIAPVVGIVWGKRRTLEIYLNVIEWGEGVYGIQAASRLYFGRPVSQLTLGQAAALAAVLPSPRRLSPKNLSAVSRQRYERIVKEAATVPLPTNFYLHSSGKRRARS